MKNSNQLLEDMKQYNHILVGIGEEWGFVAGDLKADSLLRAYERLMEILEGKDYFVITTAEDGKVYQTGVDSTRITAPCGNLNWRQCQEACTRDIWEAGEVDGEICPHCGAPLTANTIEAENYIEEGYLPSWKEYISYLTSTLNKELLILELGVGFQTPTVIRWPFEKTVFFNKKAKMYRVHESFSQAPEELKDRIISISADSVQYFINL